MAIEEKPRVLEFAFVPDGIGGDFKYDIIYDEGNEPLPLKISCGGNSMEYPLDLLTEIVEFLTKKGVIESSLASRTAPTPGIGPSVVTPTSAPMSSIPVPHIRKKDGTVAATTANVDPLVSFDITTDLPTPSIQPSVPAPSASVPGAPPIPKITKTTTAPDGSIVMGQVPAVPSIPSIPATTPSSKITPEMMRRPVIRSRVTGNDPTSAEKEAAMIRRQSGAGAGKTIRRAHRAEE